MFDETKNSTVKTKHFYDATTITMCEDCEIGIQININKGKENTNT